MKQLTVKLGSLGATVDGLEASSVSVALTVAVMKAAETAAATALNFMMTVRDAAGSSTQAAEEGEGVRAMREGRGARSGPKRSRKKGSQKVRLTDGKTKSSRGDR